MEAGRMTGEQFGEALARLDMSPAALAGLLRVNPREVRRWLAGTAPVPGGIAAFMPVALAVVARTPPADLAALLRSEADKLVTCRVV
jgi:hypothetical protein